MLKDFHLSLLHFFLCYLPHSLCLQLVSSHTPHQLHIPLLLHQRHTAVRVGGCGGTCVHYCKTYYVCIYNIHCILWSPVVTCVHVHVHACTCMYCAHVVVLHVHVHCPYPAYCLLSAWMVLLSCLVLRDPSPLTRVTLSFSESLSPSHLNRHASSLDTL